MNQTIRQFTQVNPITRTTRDRTIVIVNRNDYFVAREIDNDGNLTWPLPRDRNHRRWLFDMIDYTTADSYDETVELLDEWLNVNMVQLITL